MVVVVPQELRMMGRRSKSRKSRSSSLCTKVAKLGSRSQQSWSRESNYWKVAKRSLQWTTDSLSHVKFAFRKDWEFLFSRIKYSKQEKGGILLNFAFSMKRFLCLHGHQILVFLNYNKIPPSTCVYPLSYISLWKRNLFPSSKAAWFRD